jgi:hypothetical protein
MLDIEKVTVISDEMRAVVESEWPELVHKLPPRGSKTRGGKKWTFLRRILVLRSDATRMALGDTSWCAAPLAHHSGSTGGEYPASSWPQPMVDNPRVCAAGKSDRLMGV